MRSILSALLLLLAMLPCFAADIMMRDLEGNDISFASLKGKWVFINYWASWCNPCVDEIAEFNQFYDARKDQNIAVYAVNFDSLPLNKQQRLTRKFDIHYPSLQRRSLHDLPQGSLSVVPITLVFNPQGKLFTTLYGGQTLASLNEIITSTA